MGTAAGWCSVQGCPGRQYDVYFKFPEDEALCDGWLKVVKSPKSKKLILLGPSYRICSLHFANDDYDKIVEDGGLILEHLKPIAIPSIFPWTESWPFNKKKKKEEEGANDKKPSESQKKEDTKKAEQTFACPTCDFMTNRIDNWQNHRRSHEEQHRHSCDQCNFSTDSLDLLDIHFSRDHNGSTTETGVFAVPQKPTTSSTGAAKSGARKSIRQKALDKKDYQKVAGGGYNVGSESNGRTQSNLPSGTNILKSASSTKLTKSPGTQRGDIKTGASQNGMYLDRPHSGKREFDTTPIVLDSSSSDQEKEDEVTDTATVKKEVEASGGKKKERKVIWVVSGTADD